MKTFVLAVAALLGAGPLAWAGADAEQELKAKLPEIFAKAAEHYKALDAAATSLMKGKSEEGKSEEGKSEADVEYRVPHGWKKWRNGRDELDMRPVVAISAGCFPGSLWYLYEATGDAHFRDRATAWTELFAPNVKVTGYHDVAQNVLCTYGNARRLLKTDKYDGLLVEMATTLCRRFNEDLGFIRSWGPMDEKNAFLVVPDSVMTLELLEEVKVEGEGEGEGGGRRFDRIARSHADATMRYLFRPDGGCRHIVDFDVTTKCVRTVWRGQGADCMTAWSCGQSKSVYGYTMMYRLTKDVRYLDFAKKLADYAINHPNMPADGVPYWDYGAPGEERDSAAAAILASALLELSQFVGAAEGARYRAFAVQQLRTLSSSAYFSEGAEAGHFLLKHGVGSRSEGEIDTPLAEGDYYYLEALLRFRKVASSGPALSPEDVFRSPPREAHVGVWWHWMGAQVTREGIVADLDWMRRMGVAEATVFGMADSCTPWAKRIANVPTGGLRPYSDAWWKLFRFACAEARTRGIGIGLHNCPGYTCTGGPWIPPRLAMRELVFNVTNAEQIATKPSAIFPVYDEDAKTFRLPPCPARRTDYRRLGCVNGIEIGHVPMGAFVQPADWDSFGLECDKMNPEAVAFHLDHVLGELKRHLGDDLPAAGLSFVHLDSYEAGTPTWTPRMREEFQERRGYDCWRFLPVLGGFTNGYTAAEVASFRRDWDRTVKDLYRDALFAQMSKRLHAEGLAFSNEPYEGPFDSREAARHVDRLMTEFWYEPGKPRDEKRAFRHTHFNTFRRADGTRHNIVAAEAFTGWPTQCAWTETPGLLKPCGDRAWLDGVNRFVLHTCPLQPWGADVRPGVTMGWWGTHFGRNQTWAESGRCWFDYLARSQALLQWGEPSTNRLPVAFAQCARAAGGRTVHFLVNESDEERPLALAGAGAWFDSVTGTIGAAPRSLAPRQSGFWVTGGAAVPPQAAFGESLFLTQWTPALGDWTRSTDPAVRYFSGMRTYRATFSCAKTSDAELSLGKVLGATAQVCVNGVDCGTAWCAPWTVRVPRTVLRAGENTVEIDVTNVWANRLIGDEREPPDVVFEPGPVGDPDRPALMTSYPDWFVKGLSARPSKGRRCFVTWNYFTQDSPLVPSGLVGPVALSRSPAEF